jgi:ferredoxin--NADP+ reductase
VTSAIKPLSAPVASSGLQSVEVLAVHHWTDELFSFKTTRDPAFRFQSGQFVMIGLEVDGRSVMRAYSIASPSWDDTLEFYSIKVADGQLTSHLRQIEAGQRVLIGRKATGTLVLNALRPGRALYLLGTGTGLAPFLSLAREPDVYERFERVVVVHGCRQQQDLSYADQLTDVWSSDPDLGPILDGKLCYFPTLTREPFRNNGRITDLIATGALEAALGVAPLDPSIDRIMICGSAAMLRDTAALLEARGFCEGSVSRPGDYVLERAFVDS